MPKALVTSLGGQEGPHLSMLANAGFEVAHTPEGADLWQEDDLISALDGVSAIVAGSEPYTPRVIESSPNLRVIARSGVGFDAVNLDACNEQRIVVATTPGVNHHAVAEHTISLLMGVARDFPKQDQHVRNAQWYRRRFPRVMGSTLGIIGLGRIGRAVATRARGLGMNVVSFDPYASEEFADQWQIELTDLDGLLGCSDYVTLHSPATADTKHLINAATIAKMKPGSVVINTARGSLIKETDLIDALKSGHLRAAGLDVFEVEPLPADSPLLEMDNVLLSGHIAGLDNESHNGMFGMCAEIIIALHSGGWPREECVRNEPGRDGWQW